MRREPRPAAAEAIARPGRGLDIEMVPPAGSAATPGATIAPKPADIEHSTTTLFQGMAIFIEVAPYGGCHKAARRRSHPTNPPVKYSQIGAEHKAACAGARQTRLPGHRHY